MRRPRPKQGSRRGYSSRGGRVRCLSARRAKVWQRCCQQVAAALCAAAGVLLLASPCAATGSSGASPPASDINAFLAVSRRARRGAEPRLFPPEELDAPPQRSRLCVHNPDGLRSSRARHTRKSEGRRRHRHSHVPLRARPVQAPARGTVRRGKEVRTACPAAPVFFSASANSPDAVLFARASSSARSCMEDEIEETGRSARGGGGVRNLLLRR